ncbi:hypothetical protein JK162_06010 [Leuconostoc pseudomesenteroides]|jgi:uncharacterized protein|uniref:hypothetical protein n=1 Tax=Leuconostoc pseudomesenteroides TaxID=33968 RepID=UPI001B8CC199|nr:hypothetical protein [Leuconostoc pseudomesenteroides]MBS0958055.1 hypothetical protein [Leuconostoc pseudomesenteroides]
MYYIDGQFYQLGYKQKISFFVVSLIINSFGNGLSVATAMGSAPWTAGAANLANLTGAPISLFLAFFATSVAFLNMWLAMHFNWPRLIGNIVFGMSFSLLVGVFANLFVALGIRHLTWWWLLPIDIFAVWTIGVAISIYQRVNWILHPLDDLTNILRFDYFHGNASKAQMSNFAVAIGISAFCFPFSHQLVALGLGTIVSFLFQGRNIAWADRHIFKRLVHGDITGEA